MTDAPPKKPVSPERLAQLAEMRAKVMENRRIAARVAAEAAEPASVPTPKRPADPPATPPPVRAEPEKPQTLAELGLGEADDLKIDDILTDDEIAEIRAAAKAKVAAEQRAARKKRFMDAALEEARREAGAIPADEEFDRQMKEEVSIFIDMPRLRKPTGGEHSPEPIIIDQRVFVPGRAYTVQRAQAEYLIDLMDKARRHVAFVDGRTRTYFDTQANQMVYQGGRAAGGPSGPSFDAVHRRPS